MEVMRGEYYGENILYNMPQTDLVQSYRDTAINGVIYSILSYNTSTLN